jgi:hypothetical protein
MSSNVSSFAMSLVTFTVVVGAFSAIASDDDDERATMRCGRCFFS